MNTNIDMIWTNILKHQNEVFCTKTGNAYTYMVEDNYLVVSPVKNGRIPKEYFEKALFINNPTPSKLQNSGIWGPSYVYGIITDNRIKNIYNSLSLRNFN